MFLIDLLFYIIIMEYVWEKFFHEQQYLSICIVQVEFDLALTVKMFAFSFLFLLAVINHTRNFLPNIFLSSWLSLAVPFWRLVQPLASPLLGPPFDRPAIRRFFPGCGMILCPAASRLTGWRRNKYPKNPWADPPFSSFVSGVPLKLSGVL